MVIFPLLAGLAVFFWLLPHPRRAAAAKALLLRKQLAICPKRGVKPRRADATAHVLLLLLPGALTGGERWSKSRLGRWSAGTVRVSACSGPGSRGRVGQPFPASRASDTANCQRTARQAWSAAFSPRGPEVPAARIHPRTAWWSRLAHIRAQPRAGDSRLRLRYRRDSNVSNAYVLVTEHQTGRILHRDVTAVRRRGGRSSKMLADVISLGGWPPCRNIARNRFESTAEASTASL